MTRLTRTSSVGTTYKPVVGTATYTDVGSKTKSEVYTKTDKVKYTSTVVETKACTTKGGYGGGY
jgi:hypothetical protein